MNDFTEYLSMMAQCPFVYFVALLIISLLASIGGDYERSRKHN